MLKTEFCVVCNQSTTGELAGLRLQENGSNLMKEFEPDGAHLLALMCRNCYAKVAKAVQKIIK